MAEINTSDLEELIIKNTPVTDAPSSGEATGGKPETAGGPGAEIDLALAELPSPSAFCWRGSVWC